MHTQDARKWLSGELIKAGLAPADGPVFDLQGHAGFTSKEGVACLFSIPEQNSHWYMFSRLREIEPSRDGTTLAFALALNLQPKIMQGTSIGLNLESRQLLLTQMIEIEPALLDVKAAVNHFVDGSIRIGEELNKLYQENNTAPLPPFHQSRPTRHSLIPGLTIQAKRNLV